MVCMAMLQNLETILVLANILCSIFMVIYCILKIELFSGIMALDQSIHVTRIVLVE